MEVSCFGSDASIAPPRGQQVKQIRDRMWTILDEDFCSAKAVRGLDVHDMLEMVSTHRLISLYNSLQPLPICDGASDVVSLRGWTVRSAAGWCWSCQLSCIDQRIHQVKCINTSPLLDVSGLGSLAALAHGPADLHECRYYGAGCAAVQSDAVDAHTINATVFFTLVKVVKRQKSQWQVQSDWRQTVRRTASWWSQKTSLTPVYFMKTLTCLLRFFFRCFLCLGEI